jgi:hypothetical protein
MLLRSIGIGVLFIAVIIVSGAWGMGIDYVALRVGITGDILYPLALGPPFITFKSGWSP